MDGEVNILGFAGSLRKGSYNRLLLRAAVEMAPSGCKIEVFDLEGIPPSTRTRRRLHRTG